MYGDVHTFDVENRFKSTTAGGVTTSFVYNGDGQRVSKTVSGGSGYTTYYIGNYYEVKDPVSGSNVITKYYYFGAQRVAMKVDSTIYYLRGDHLGSSSVVLDNAGAMYSRQTYYPYGETRTQQGSALPTDFTFTGQRADVGELMDYGAREYDLVHAQFIQPDSIVPDLMNPQLLNRYAYVSNNPVRYTDPTGHMMDDGLWGGGGGGGSPTTPTTPIIPPPAQPPPATLPADTPDTQYPNGKACWPHCNDEGTNASNEVAEVLYNAGILLDAYTVGIDTAAAGIEWIGVAGLLMEQPEVAVPAFVVSQTLVFGGNVLSFNATAMTAIADIVAGETRISMSEVIIGEDTQNSVINTVVGTMVPTATANAVISIHQFAGNDFGDVTGVPTSKELITSTAGWARDTFQQLIQ